MSRFVNLIQFPIYNLHEEYLSLIETNKIKWNKFNQICITTVKGMEEDYYYGVGSLYYDWNTQQIVDNKINVKPRDVPLQEIDFTEICSVFRGTLFEDALNLLKTHYIIGRVRLMRSMPKTCLSWHIDDTIRIHYPLKTQEGCLMIIENEVKHLPIHTWWETDTRVSHTAMNASTEDRIHLVASVIEKK